MKEKLGQIRQLLAAQGLDGILVESQANFHWLTGGGRGFIGLNTETACAAVLVTASQAYLLSSNIEAERLLAEEVGFLAGDGATTSMTASGSGRLAVSLERLEFPWYEEEKRQELIHHICGKNYCSDSALAREFQQLRTVLGPAEQDICRQMGPLIAGVLEEVLQKVRPGVSELAVAGWLSAGLWALGVEPVTLLVAFDERMFAWRHPLPTANQLKQLALAAVAVRYRGIFFSATRQIAVGKLPGDLAAQLADRHAAARRIDAGLMDATVPGRSLAVLYQQLQELYREAGYPGEWRHHHQGGLSGYVSRESKALPGNGGKVQESQLFAWNPTVQGAKSEDTILVGPGGPTVITYTGCWEYELCEGILRPVIRQC